MLDTQEEVCEIFTYKDGKLLWKIKSAARIKIGDIAGTVHKEGYRYVIYHGKYYLVHRLVFLYVNGYLPNKIDHRNGIRDDNRIENLRSCDDSENAQNRKPLTGQTSIYKGVHFRKNRQRWQAYIKLNGKRHYLGSFINEKDAARTYDVAAKHYFGKYAKTNKDFFKDEF